MANAPEAPSRVNNGTGTPRQPRMAVAARSPQLPSQTPKSWNARRMSATKEVTHWVGVRRLAHNRCEEKHHTRTSGPSASCCEHRAGTAIEFASSFVEVGPNLANLLPISADSGQGLPSVAKFGPASGRVRLTSRDAGPTSTDVGPMSVNWPRLLQSVACIHIICAGFVLQRLLAQAMYESISQNRPSPRTDLGQTERVPSTLPWRIRRYRSRRSLRRRLAARRPNPGA